MSTVNKEKKKGINIAVYSWNESAIEIRTKITDEDQLIEDKKSYCYYLGYKSTGNAADFFSKIKYDIDNNQLDIVVVGTQESRKPGSYFHSSVLIEEMEKIGYSLLKRTRLMGIGVSTYKNVRNEYKLTARGLRTSIFVKSDMLKFINNEEKEYDLDDHVYHVCGGAYSKNKGAIGTYVKWPGLDPFLFINCHLPFDAASLVEYKKDGLLIARKNAVMKSNIAFNEIIKNLVYNNEHRPMSVFVLGDLNYRVTPTENMYIASEEYFSIDYISQVKKYDELFIEMKSSNIVNFNEGVNKVGITFMPTCKLNKNRNSGEYKYKMGKYKQRFPSWCDRILYNNFYLANNIVECKVYDRFDIGNMTKSDHCGVYAIFSIL